MSDEPKDPLTPEQEEWVMDLAEKHGLGRRVGAIGTLRGAAPDVFYTDASYRTYELFCFAAAMLAATPKPQEQAAQVVAVPGGEPANIRERWNIERDGDDLLICFDNHGKGEKCEYVRFVKATTPQPASEPVASIYVSKNGEREFDDWRVPLPVGRNELYATPQPAAKPAQACKTQKECRDTMQCEIEGRCLASKPAQAERVALKPLTQDQIVRMKGRHGVTSNGRGVREYDDVATFAREVIAKFCEVNGLTAPAGGEMSK